MLNAALAVVLAGAVTAAALTVGTPSTATASTEQTAMVARGTVSATVTASGNLKAAQSLGVSFAGTGGTVTKIQVKVGQRVRAGQALATIDDTSARQSLDSAKASLASARAGYESTTQDQTSAERSRDRASVDSARVSLTNATRTLSQARQTYRLDSSQQDSLVSAAQDDYDAAKDSTARSTALSALEAAKRTRASTLLRDRQTIASDQGQVTAADVSLTSAKAAAAVNAQGAQPGAVASAQAQITSAQVQVDQAQVTVDQTTLRAPAAGTVASISGKVSETSSSTSGAASASSTGTASETTGSTTGSTTGFLVLSSLDRLQVTTKVAEADAAQVKVGQVASVTFSASSTTLAGTVTSIDLTSTVTNNVVEYGVTVSLTESSPTLKLGQTASVSITTGTAENVLSIPSSAASKVGTITTVRVRKDGVDATTPVQLGLEGDSNDEVRSGLSVGDEVVLTSGSGLPSGFSFPAGGVPGAGAGGGLGG